MNKNINIFVLSLALSAASLTNVEAVTTQKILSRVQKNTERIRTKKINMRMEVKLPSGETIKTAVSLLYKNPDKIKMEGDSSMPVIIITGKTLTIKLTTGQKITKILSPEDMQNIARPEMGFKFRAFISSSSISPVEKESDIKKGLYVLEITPATGGDNEILQKVKWYVDYKKGFINKTEVFNSKGLAMSLNYSDFKRISGSWLPLRSEMTMSSANGDVVTISTYEYTQLNKDISDKEFQP